MFNNQKFHLLTYLSSSVGEMFKGKPISIEEMVHSHLLDLLGDRTEAYLLNGQFYLYRDYTDNSLNLCRGDDTLYQNLQGKHIIKWGEWMETILKVGILN